MEKLDSGHTEILLNKKIKPKKIECVEFHNNRVTVWNHGKHQLKNVFKYIQSNGAVIEDVKTVKDSLQDIFLRLTK